MYNIQGSDPLVNYVFKLEKQAPTQKKISITGLDGAGTHAGVWFIGNPPLDNTFIDIFKF